MNAFIPLGVRYVRAHIAVHNLGPGRADSPRARMGGRRWR